MGAQDMVPQSSEAPRLHLLAMASLSPQALAHPCPAALSSPAPWDRPQLGPASLCDRATHATPGHLRPCALDIPSCRQGSMWGTHSTLQLPLAKVPGRTLAHITDWSQSHGKLYGQCWCLDTCPLGGCRQPRGEVAELLLPAPAGRAARISTGTGQHWHSSALKGWAQRMAPPSAPRGVFLRPSTKYCFFKGSLFLLSCGGHGILGMGEEGQC